MAHKTISVTFSIEAQNWRDGQFSIPVEYCRLLGVDQGDPVLLSIRSWDGYTPLYAGSEQLKSGNEIYSNALRDAVSAGQVLIVEVSAAK